MSSPSDPAWFVARDGRVARADPDSLRPQWSAGGTYSLLLSLPSARTVDVGALGRFELPPGAYVYTGSALGSGGFSRVDRHLELVAGERGRRHWHGDHLTDLPDVRLDSVFLAPGLDVECSVALPDGPVGGFGASDCSCRSHLGYARSADYARWRHSLRERVRRTYARRSSLRDESSVESRRVLGRVAPM